MSEASQESIERLADAVEEATGGDFSDAQDAMANVTAVLQDRSNERRAERRKELYRTSWGRHLDQVNSELYAENQRDMKLEDEHAGRKHA